MHYDRVEIPTGAVPRASDPLFQHLVDTYGSETNKTASIWRAFDDGYMEWRPHAKSSTGEEFLRHQLLSVGGFLPDFLGFPEPPAAQVLPAASTIDAFTGRLVELAAPRLQRIAAQPRDSWFSPVRFFDVDRE